MKNTQNIMTYILNSKFFNGWLALLCASQFFLSILHAQSYGTLEIALLLNTPNYEGNNALLFVVQENEKRLKTTVLTEIIPNDKKHITLSYPLIPLDYDVIKLFPYIESEVEAMPAEKKSAEYQTKIPAAMGPWLTAHVRNWFSTAEAWKDPILLPFSKLRQLSKFLVAEFKFDEMGRLPHIIEIIKTRLEKQFPKVYYAFSDMIPHISIGILNPLFDMQLLMQPTMHIPPLFIFKESQDNIIASVRIKKENLPANIPAQ